MYNTLYNNKSNDKINLDKKYSGYIVKSEDGSNSLSLEKTGPLIEHFWTALALCHTCSVETNDNGIEEYICVSPDSIELVKAAKSQGWKFEESEKPDSRIVALGEEGKNKI